MDSRNQADTMLHTTEKSLKEHGSKISDAEKKAIETASANLRNALKGTDSEEIKKKTQELVQASMKLGEAIYKESQAEAADGASAEATSTNEDAGPSGPEDAKVVDAEFEEVDPNEEKKENKKSK